jgi:nucleoside-diphosphate kinase
MERTLIILKPSAVQRGLVGEIISRFEKVGLKIAGTKLTWPSRDLMDKHYPAEREEWVAGLGKRTIESYKELGLDVNKQFKEVDPSKIGHEVRDWLVQSMMAGPVMAVVLEGPHAIEIARKIVGHTLPQKAEPGTVRGDYSFDSAALANKNHRPVNNLIHASGNAEEAEHEIELWFSPKELHDYQTVHQKHMME